MQSLGTDVADLGVGLNIYGNLKRGGARGDVAAASGAARLGANAGLFGDASSAVGKTAGEFSNVLGIVSGVEQGGVAGYGGAAINAAELGAKTGVFGDASGEVGQLAGEAVIPLSVYEFAKNWRSGATGSDALSGAGAGAAIGSVVPGVGTLLGAAVGAIVGGVSSIFGPGREDPENVGWNQYAQAFHQGGAAGVAGASPSQNFQMLAGIFDSRGSQIPFYNAYGRMGESRFVSDMGAKINEAISSGKVPANATPQQIYQSVVGPWVTAMGGAQGWQNTSTIQGAPEKAAVENLLTSLIGDYTSGQLTASTPVGISGQTIAGLQPYAGNLTSPSATGGFPVSIPGSTGPTGTQAAASMLPLVLAGVGAPGVQSGTGAPMAPQVGINDPTSLNLMGAATMGGTNFTGTPNQAGTPAAGAGMTSGAGGGLSPFDTSLITGGIGILGAGYAQHQNAGVISPLTAAGAPFIDASQQLLGQSLGGQLTPAQQTASTTAQTQGKTLVQAATPVGQIAQGLFQQYQSGNLKPADQAQLDQQVTAAKAQIAQALGPNADSTTLATYYDQIDQQALITKQTMLNSYLATGNQEFDQWSTTTQAGQAAILAGQQYAVTQIDNTFNKALEAGSLGGNDIMAAITATLQSNQDLAKSFGSYMSNLGKAYSLGQAAQAGIGAAGGAGGGAGGPGLTPDQQASMEGDINTAGTQALNSDYYNILTGINNDTFAPAPQGSVTAFDIPQTDVMSQISPDFSSANQSSLPAYTGY